MKNGIYIVLGWIFVTIGAIGAVLPLLPTTPFLIVALVLFSKSSPRFHRMLLNNRWFGPGLRQWEASRSISRPIKKRATILIIITFGISIAILIGRSALQIMLMIMCAILLVFIWRLPEVESTDNDQRTNHN